MSEERIKTGGKDRRHNKKQSYLNTQIALKGMVKNNFCTTQVAMDILDVYKKTDWEKYEYPTVSGYEFMDGPPTAVNRRVFVNSIAAMIYASKRFSEAVENNELEDDIKDIMQSVINVERRVLAFFFTACGLDPETKEPVDREHRKEAYKAFLKGREEFKNAVQNWPKSGGIELIEQRKKAAGIEDIIPPSGDVFDRRLKALITANSPEAEKHRERLSVIENKSRELVKEVIGRRTSVFETGKMIREYMKDESRDIKERNLLETSFMYYNSAVGDILGKLFRYINAYYYEAKWLLTGAPVDSIIHKVITEECGGYAECYDDDTPVNKIRGYVDLESVAEGEVKILSSPEEVKQVALEVQDYVFRHPEQYEAQSPISVFADIEMLPLTARKAQSVTIAAERLLRPEVMASCSAEEIDELKEAWVLCDTVERISYVLYDYYRACKGLTIKEAAALMKKITSHINFVAVEAKSGKGIQMVINKRRLAGVSP